MKEITVNAGRDVIHWDGSGIYIANPGCLPNHFRKLTGYIAPGAGVLSRQCYVEPIQEEWNDFWNKVSRRTFPKLAQGDN